MHLGVLNRGAVARIDRVLHHRKTVLDQILAEARISLSLSGGAGRQVEHGNDPHASPSPWNLRDGARVSHGLTPPLPPARHPAQAANLRAARACGPLR